MTDFVKLASNFQQYFGALQSDSKGTVDASTLMWLAKTAAREYLTNKTPLNDSILKLAQTEKNLNTEHLRRISEMANNEVFEKLFNNSSDKNVHFDVADSDSIINKLASRSKIASCNTSSYKHSPKDLNRTNYLNNSTYTKTATINNNVASDISIQQLSMGSNEHSDPKRDVYDLKEKLEATKEELLTEKLANSHNLKVAYDTLYNSIKVELRDTTFDKIASAMCSVASKTSDLDVLEDITYDLLRHKLASFDQLNIRPTNNSMVNTEHPLVENFLGYTKLANKKKLIELAIDDVNTHIEKTASFIQKMSER